MRGIYLFSALVVLLLRTFVGSALADNGSQATTAIHSGPARAEAGPAQMTWAVADRFRLLSREGNKGLVATYVRDHNRKGEGKKVPNDASATDVLFARYLELYERAGKRVLKWDLPHTRWNGKDAYEPDYVGPKAWDVVVDTNIDGNCRWTIASVPEPRPESCHHHTITVHGPTTVAATPVSEGAAVSVEVTPRDVLIATIGDSYASGEGVPDLGRYYFKNAGHPALWMDERCHRSLWSAPGLAALMYAEINPHVSVTHVTLACSGASLNMTDDDGKHNQGGLLTPYEGVVPPPGAPPLSPQMDVLKKTLTLSDGTAVKPQFLIVSIGGNDLGFADVVRKAIHGSVDALKNVIKDKTNASVMQRIDGGVRDLQARLESVGASYRDGTRVIVMQYPNPSKIWKIPPLDAGHASQWKGALYDSCGVNKSGDISLTPVIYSIDPLKIGIIDKQLIEDKLTPYLKDLNATLHFDLQSSGFDQWREDFNQHGYCGPGLSGAKRARWINSLADSYELLSSLVLGPHLGPLFANFLDHEGTKGTMHPNILGQSATARWILDQIVADECETDVPQDDRLCDQSKPWRAEIPGYPSHPDLSRR